MTDHAPLPDGNIAICINDFLWKKQADFAGANEPYLLSMAIDEHCLLGTDAPMPLFLADPFPNVRVGQRISFLGHGHVVYGPRQPGRFVAISLLWMESDRGLRQFGDELQRIAEDPGVGSLLGRLAGQVALNALPQMALIQQLSKVVAGLCKLNADDRIFRTDGIFLRDLEPPYCVGSDRRYSNDFVDFNVAVHGLREQA